MPLSWCQLTVVHFVTCTSGPLCKFWCQPTPQGMEGDLPSEIQEAIVSYCPSLVMSYVCKSWRHFVLRPLRRLNTSQSLHWRKSLSVIPLDNSKRYRTISLSTFSSTSAMTKTLGSFVSPWIVLAHSWVRTKNVPFSNLWPGEYGEYPSVVLHCLFGILPEGFFQLVETNAMWVIGFQEVEVKGERVKQRKGEGRRGKGAKEWRGLGEGWKAKDELTFNPRAVILPFLEANLSHLEEFDDLSWASVSHFFAFCTLPPKLKKSLLLVSCSDPEFPVRLRNFNFFRVTKAD